MGYGTWECWVYRSYGIRGSREAVERESVVSVVKEYGRLEKEPL